MRTQKNGVGSAIETPEFDNNDTPSFLRPCKRYCPSAIPGPAALIQSAMLRKTLDRNNQNIDDNNCGFISTQDYIRKAMDETAEFDDEFTLHPWVSALQFLGAGEDVTPITSISSIKKCSDIGEVNQIVAVIKSCRTNGLGGLIVTLKDPTGTVGGIIHHKVLSENKFRKNLCVGSVLILQKVSIFTPVRSAQYLNITLRNLVKVFCKDGDSSSTQDNSTQVVQYVHSENSRKPSTCEVIKDKRQNTTHAEIIQNHSLFEKQNLFARSSQYNNRSSSNTIAAVRTENSQSSQIAFSKTPENIIRNIDITGYRHDGGNCVVLEGSDEEVQGATDSSMKKQPQIVKPSLPQWTDEQLDELFADDDLIM